MLFGKIGYKFLVVLFLLLAFVYRINVGDVWRNVGFVFLNHEGVANEVNGLAEDGFRRAIMIDGHDVDARRGLGFALLEQGKESEAMAIWQQVDGMAVELMGWAAQAAKVRNYGEAMRWYERAAELEGEFGDPWFFMGELQVILGDEARAAELYGVGIERPFRREVGLSDYYVRLADLAEDNSDEALSYVETALQEADFGDALLEKRAHYVRAELLRSRGEWETAVTEYRWVLAHYPRDYWSHVHLGFLVWELEENANEAERLFLQAATVNDKDKWAHRGLGMIYAAMNRQDEAMNAYLRVLEIDRTDEVACDFVGEK